MKINDDVIKSLISIPFFKGKQRNDCSHQTDKETARSREEY
jgi:hypothetical protein